MYSYASVCLFIYINVDKYAFVCIYKYVYV